VSGQSSPTVAVVTVTHGRDPHLRAQQAGLGARASLHVVVRMGEPAAGGGGRGGCPTVEIGVPTVAGALPLSQARNVGAAEALAAGADVLIFLDVDCIPGPDLVAGYARAALARPAPALFAGPVAYLPPVPVGGYPVDRLSDLAAPHPGRPVPAPGRLQAESRLELFWSLSFAVSAATWRYLGGFHEGYVGYGAEDTDFALSAGRAGAQLYWVGGATAYHQHHLPARHDPARIGELVANARLFFSRHGSWPMRPWLEQLAADGSIVFDPTTETVSLALPAATIRP
jgi:GT2 family glycosyltransferase